MFLPEAPLGRIDGETTAARVVEVYVSSNIEQRCLRSRHSGSISTLFEASKIRVRLTRPTGC